MFLSKEENIIKGYVNFRIPSLNLVEDGFSINKTIKIQSEVLEYDAVLINNQLTVDNDSVLTVMV